MKANPNLLIALDKYFNRDFQEDNILNGCPICGEQRKSDTDTIANVMCASIDTCEECGYVEEYAYGAFRAVFQGGQLPDDNDLNRIAIGILRKLHLFIRPLSREESNLLSVLLGDEELSETEFDELQNVVTHQNQ